MQCSTQIIKLKITIRLKSYKFLFNSIIKKRIKWVKIAELIYRTKENLNG